MNVIVGARVSLSLSNSSGVMLFWHDEIKKIAMTPSKIVDDLLFTLFRSHSQHSGAYQDA